MTQTRLKLSLSRNHGSRRESRQRECQETELNRRYGVFRPRPEGTQAHGIAAETPIGEVVVARRCSGVSCPGSGWRKSNATLRLARYTWSVSAATAKILAEALTLPTEARAELADALYLSLDGEIENPDEVAAAWAVEIQRRVADLDAGRTKAVPMAEAMARIRENLKARREARDR